MKTPIFIFFLCMCPALAFAGEMATPTPSDPKSWLPTAADEMPVSQQEKVRKDVADLSGQHDQMKRDTWSGKFKVWSQSGDKDGRLAENQIGVGDGGKVRFYKVSWIWQHTWEVNTYYYDEAGHLRLVDVFSRVSGQFQLQTIFLDKKKKVLKVEYEGPFIEKDGLVRTENKTLTRPALLADGSNVEMIWNPIEEMSRDPLAPLASKPGTKTKYPFLGFNLGEPNGLNLVAGYNWERIGLMGEGMYWNQGRYDGRGAVSFNLMREFDGSLGSSRMDFLYVFGVGNLTLENAPGHFYSGFGLQNRFSGLTMEIDFVDNCFWNFSDNHWAWLVNFGWLMKL